MHSPEHDTTANGVRIRTITVDDFEDYCDIFEQPRVIWGTLQRPFFPREKRREWIEQSQRDESSYLLGAEVEGRLVGELSVHPTRNPRTKHTAALGMAVHDAFQGRGVGSALVAAAIDLADKWLNIVRIELDVYTDNEPAVALYNKFGFAIEGTHRLKAFRDGRLVDTYSMARLRNPEGAQLSS